MKEINERWLANGSINIGDITSKSALLGKAIDDILKEDGIEKPTTHRIHREMARIYRGKLNDAIKDDSFVRAEIITQTMINSYNPAEIMFWYDNPDFKDEEDGDYHHNSAGKDKIKKIRSCAEDLQASLGSFEDKLYAKRPWETEGIFKKIMGHICKTDVETHAKAVKDDIVGSEYKAFISSIEDITYDVRRAIVRKEGGTSDLKTALNKIDDLHKKYNERFLGEKYHDVCKRTRVAAEKFLIDVALLRTVIMRYLNYKDGQNSLYEARINKMYIM
ncbi:MAG: hypothetical protein Q7J54_00920 [Candidatus Woesearchaeota archaeon]|nr:hypothetical protein [Candidatus Woesearchaeota archaeon]